MATDYRKQFQSLNLVFNYNKTEPLFLRFTLAFLKLKELRCDIALLSKCLQFSDQGTTKHLWKLKQQRNFFLFVSFFSSIIYLFLEIKSPKYRIILDICSLNNQEICDELLIMHMHGCIFILFYFFCHLSVKWLHVDFPKVLRRISYGAVRRTFHTLLAPILPTQKRVGAVGPIRVAPKTLGNKAVTHKY